MLDTTTEQRSETRTTLSWPVSIWVPNANRFFPGESSNISKTGVYLKVPMTTPLGPGSIVELNFPRTNKLAQEKGQYARIKRGRVVRVDRETTLQDANIGVGIVFEQ
jgi:hypothetical protein